MSRKRGDVNNDGKIGTLDAIYMLGHIAGLSSFQLSEESLRAADVKNSGSGTSVSNVSYFLNNLVGNEGYEISGSLFTYEFPRDSFANTVNYSGQTARIRMAKEIHTALNFTTYTGGSIKSMYLNSNANFPSGATYDSSKQIWEKLGYGYSTSNSDAEANVATIQADFQKHIDNFNSIK